MKELVVFDMDGLLIDTETIYDEAWIETFDKFEIKDKEEILFNFKGMSDATSRVYLGNKLNDEDAYDRMLPSCTDLFWEIIKRDGVQIKEGAQELLHWLNDYGVRTALATSTSKMRAERLLELSKLETFFEFHCYGNMVTHSKPHPEMYNLVATLSNLEKEKLVILEDSINGVKAANGANIDVIWVPELEYDGLVEDFEYLKKFSTLTEAQPFIEELLK